MGVEVTVTGTGRWAGAKSNIDAYEVIEDSTPTEASDSSGGTGQLKFKAIEDPSRFGSALLLNNDVELSDGDRGLTQGKINDITSNEGILDITADSRLGRLVIDKTALPVHDTFANVITYYLSLGGITTGIAIDPTIGAIYVEAPGWTGDLWTKIKELCVVYGAEIALLRTNVAVRPVRQRRALEINNSSEQWVISNRELAKQVEVCYYNTQWKEDSLIYPKGGWTPDVPIYTVDAGQTITVNIPVGVSLTSITPLTAFSSMPIDYTGPSSGYCVIGNDNVIVPGSEWTAGGGLITAEIGADGSSIDLTIVGANTPYAPYRIASVDTDGTTFYSSLRIQGDGIHYERNSIIVDTAADETTTSRDIGVTVDNIFIETEAQARSLALDVASRWATPRRELRITKSTISKPGETGQDYDFATFAQFDAYAAANSIVTFADFDAAWAGDTFADFDNYWYDLVSDDFDYQVFGNVNGARVAWRRAMWRIRTATIGMDTVQYTAEEDTTIGDFDASANRTPVYSWSPIQTNLATNPSFESVTPGAIEARRNLFQDPNADNPASTYWLTSTAALTQVSGAAFGRPNARLFTLPAPDAQRNGVRISLAPNTTYTARARVRWQIPAFPTTVRTNWQFNYRPSGITSTVGQVAFTGITIPADTVMSIEQSFTTTSTVAGGAPFMGFINGSGNTGEWMELVDFEIELGDTRGMGWISDLRHTDPDLTFTWVGATNASESTLIGAGVNNVTTPTSTQAVRWSTAQAPFNGTRAARYRLGTTGAIGIPAVGFAPTTGVEYTLVLRVRPVTRDLSASPRIRDEVGSLQTFPVGVWTETRVTVPAGSGTTAQTGLIIAASSGHAVGDLVDIDAVLLIQGDYDGPFFDGDSADPSDTARYAWNGPADASTSSYEVRSISGYTGMTFADFDASYAGLTFEDFALIPLPNVESQYDRF